MLGATHSREKPSNNKEKDSTAKSKTKKTHKVTQSNLEIMGSKRKYAKDMKIIANLKTG